LGSINEHEFELFKDLIADKSGIILKPEKAYLIETKLTTLMLSTGVQTFSEFYDYITSGKDPKITDKIIDAITVNETMWFRDNTLWSFIKEEKLPKLAQEIISGEREKVRIWSAAVSTGQEAYTTAMCIDDYLSKNNITGVDLSNFEIFATDISERVLNLARKGRYDRISMSRGINDYYKAWYFDEKDSAWDIDNKIKDSVRFQRFNLKDSYEAHGKFDIIFCRYVLIYFSDELKRKVLEKMFNSLADNGILFTGNYVLFELVSEYFNINHYGNLTYYTKKLVTK